MKNLGRFVSIGPIVILAMMVGLACGGDDEEDGTTQPLATTADSNGNSGAPPSGESPGGDQSGDEGTENSAEIRVAGSVYEVTGGSCTQHNDGAGLSVSLGDVEENKLSISVGVVGGSQPANSGEPITDATTGLTVDGTNYIPRTESDVVVNVDTGLSGGTFEGIFVVVGEPPLGEGASAGREPVSVEGEFRC